MSSHSPPLPQPSNSSAPSADHDNHGNSPSVKFTSLEEFAEFIYTVIQKAHPVRNDAISAACRAETGVYPRHHFRDLGYDVFLTKFIRTYLPRRVVSKKCDNGDWIHDIMSPDEHASEPIENIFSEDRSETDGSQEISSHQLTKPPESADEQGDKGLQNFKNYLYDVVRSFLGPITFAEINEQCLHDLDASATILLEKLGYHDKLVNFIRAHLGGFVLCYYRDNQAYFVATPKLFPAFAPMKLIKTYPLGTLSLFAEFIYAQVVVLGGLTAPVRYHALDARCAEVIGIRVKPQLLTLGWRSAPNKFLATYPSGRLVVTMLDGVTCILVKSTQQVASIPSGSRLSDHRATHTDSHSHSAGRVVTIK